MKTVLKLENKIPNTKKLLLLFLYLTPLVALIAMVLTLSVNIPYGDQWTLIPYFEKVNAGNVSFSDLLKQHNEHRLLIPRILFSTLAFATDWNIQSEMMLSIVIASISFLAIFFISLQTHRSFTTQKSSPQDTISYSNLFYVINFFSCCFLFSWVQYENWLWGFQIPWFLINACLILSILVLTQDKISAKLRLAGAAIFCLVASFSSAHGLFIWPAIIPSVIAIAGSFKQRLARLTTWGIVSSACLLLYLVGYQRPSHLQRYYSASVGDYIAHFFVSISAPVLGNYRLLGWFSPESRDLDIVILVLAGTIIFFSFLFLAIYVLWNILFSNKKESNLLVSTAPWFSLGAFSIIFSLVNSYGRSGHSVEYALSSRYTTPNILIAIALLQIGAILMRYWHVPLKKKIVFAISALFCIFQIKTSIGAIQVKAYGGYNAISRKQHLLCAELVTYIDEQYLIQCLESNPNSDKESILKLNRLGFIKSPKDILFADDATVLLNSDQATTNLPSISTAHLDIQSAKLSGKVSLPDPPRTAPQPQAVLVSVENEKTFAAVTHLDWGSVNQQNELPWETNLTKETIEEITEKDQALNLLFYYPEQKKFIDTGVEPTLDNDIK